MNEKHYDDLPQRLLQALGATIMFMVVGWIKTLGKWAWREIREEYGRPLLIYMRRTTLYTLLGIIALLLGWDIWRSIADDNVTTLYINERRRGDSLQAVIAVNNTNKK